MRILKHCESKHNPLNGCPTLQIGTLDYFRTVTDPFIRDVKELDMAQVLDAGSGQTVSGDQIGLGRGGPIVVHGGIRFGGRAVRSRGELPNAFVFCASIEAPGQSPVSVSGKYDSRFEILCAEAFAAFVHRGLTGVTGLKYHVMHGKVTYLREKSVEHHDAVHFFRGLRTLNPSLYLYKVCVSVEDAYIDFSANCEYRFVFVPVDGEGRTTAIQAGPVQIPICGIEHVIRSA
jgi:hypothetical protein